MRLSTRLTVALSTTLLALTACTGGDEPEQPGASGDPEETATEAVVPDQVEAAWEQIDIDAEAFPARDQAYLSGILTGTAEQQPVVFGRFVEGDNGDRATVWGADGRPRDLGLGGDASRAYDAAAAGETSYLVGMVEEDGRQDPVLVTSADRTTWERVDLPVEVTERAILLDLVAVSETAAPILLGTDAEWTPVAVLPDTGQIVDLPEPARDGKITSFSAAVADADRVLAIARLQADDGRTRLVGYRSDDAGATWERVAAPGAVGARASGLVAVGDQFVATGSLTRDAATVPVAWSTEDGTDWTREPTPRIPGHTEGWDSWLSVPVVDGNQVVAMVGSDQKMFASVMRRSPNGAWRLGANLDNWMSPGAAVQVGVAPDGSLLTARGWNGRIQIRSLRDQGPGPSTELGEAPTVASWESADLVNGVPSLVGSVQEVEITVNDGWVRRSALTPYEVRGGQLTSAPWRPRGIDGLSDVRRASDPEAGEVVLGTNTYPTPVADGRSDESDVVGWHRAVDGSWTKAEGLSGERTEFVGDVERVGERWVAVGRDRADFTGAAPYVGAIWTSADGVQWQRAEGDFGTDADQRTSVNGVCETADGRTMAVGGAHDAVRGDVPRIWIDEGGTWTSADTAGLGTTTGALTNCIGVGDTTLVQGYGQIRDALFRTSDGVDFEPVTVGAESDYLGRVKQVGIGFAAHGEIDQSGTYVPVVWLSADGESWRPAPVPSALDANPGEVLDVDGDLLVPLIRSGGPDLWRITNADELVDGLE